MNVKDFEEVGDEAIARAMRFLDKDAPDIYDRPLYTSETPKDIQHAEWAQAIEAMRGGNPQLLAAKFESFASVYGPERGELLFRKWDESHRKMVMRNGTA